MINELIDLLLWIILGGGVAFFGLVMYVEWQEEKHQKELVEKACNNQGGK